LLLVWHFNKPCAAGYLRITVGTEDGGDPGARVIVAISALKP
jgi:hypothetical protein